MVIHGSLCVSQTLSDVPRSFTPVLSHRLTATLSSATFSLLEVLEVHSHVHQARIPSLNPP
jgi:hypothetical protein